MSLKGQKLSECNITYWLSNALGKRNDVAKTSVGNEASSFSFPQKAKAQISNCKQNILLPCIRFALSLILATIRVHSCNRSSEAYDITCRTRNVYVIRVVWNVGQWREIWRGTESHCLHLQWNLTHALLPPIPKGSPRRRWLVRGREYIVWWCMT